MSTPAIIWIVITAIGLGVSIGEHGKPKTGVHSFWSVLFATAISFSLLYWGGFFKS